MKTEEIYSAGIDIGTTTTQLVFSKMILQNIGGFGRIPQVKVISKQVVYKSKIYFTPLLSRDEIDGKKVYQIIKGEYEKAGFTAEDLSTGAVIITGETSRKRNASSVLKEISDVAGDFVVATAGADLESLLAGKGSGAAEISHKTGMNVVNLDIGGGTTNICIFKDGKNQETSCIDIGGRLVKINNNKIIYVAPKVKWLCSKLKLNITEGSTADVSELRKLTDAMATILAKSVLLDESDENLKVMMTNRILSGKYIPEIITFSGGVAACIKEDSDDLFKYGDIGILLAQSIKNNIHFKKANIYDASETMRATVIGAGNYSMNISGSTIEYTTTSFPMKNVPVVRAQLENEEDIENLDENIHNIMSLYTEEKNNKRQLAIAMKGLKCPSFIQIQSIADKIANQYEKEANKENALIIIFETDIGKAVGQALKHRIRGKREVLCIDGISCDSGDYIDIGNPVASGSVIPVVVKTLIFNG